MECPFELPVRKEELNLQEAVKLYVIKDAEGRVFPPNIKCCIYTEREADYIVQAINSHGKLKEALEEAGRDFYYIHQHSEDAHEDSYKFMNKAKQTLESEKKK